VEADVLPLNYSRPFISFIAAFYSIYCPTWYDRNAGPKSIPGEPPVARWIVGADFQKNPRTNKKKHIKVAGKTVRSKIGSDWHRGLSGVQTTETQRLVQLLPKSNLLP
jgi:hypothetical protein